MKDRELWNEIIIDDRYDRDYSYDGIVRKIKNTPSGAVAKMELVFKNLSFERMKQLTHALNVKPMALWYFDLKLMDFIWKELRNKYQVPEMEYNEANVFIDLANKKRIKDLSSDEAEIAMQVLIFLTKQITGLKEINVTNSEAANSEVAASTLNNDESSNSGVYIAPRVENEGFLKTLSVLQSSSKESVVNADSFGQFRSYMHVQRSIELEIISLLENVQASNKPTLIMLCGSVGDGKSHLLAYIKENRPELLSNCVVHNDSTESYDPTKTSLETLERVLNEFDDDKTPTKSSLIAINLGVLHNFYNQQKSKGKFNSLCDFIDRSGVFLQSANGVQDDSQFKLLNFAELKPFSLEANGPSSDFFLNIIDKITENHPLNPFYNAWLRDQENGISTVIHQNYGLLRNPKVKESIVQILIEAMVKEKIFISTRAFYNFIYEIIVPVTEITQSQSNFDLIQNSLPNLLFAHPDRSQLLKALSELDPLKNRSSEKDEMITEFLLSQDKQGFINNKFADEDQNSWIPNIAGIGKENYLEITKLLIRQTSLLSDYESNESYRDFINYLYAYYTGDGDKIGVLFDMLKDVVFSWNGSPMDGYIFTGSTNKEFNIAVPVQLEEDVDETIFSSMEGKASIDRFTPYLKVGFRQNNERYFFELDFALFSLLKKIRKGYRPNKQDIQNALQFNELHEKIIKSAEKNNKILLLHKKTNAMYEISKPRFSQAKFEMKKV